MSVPALWAVREYFASAHIAMLTDMQPGKRRVQPKDILDGAGLIDEWLYYPAETSWRKGQSLSELSLLFMTLRRSHFDALVYLIRDRRLLSKWRDLIFFRLAGIRQFYGHRMLGGYPFRKEGMPLPIISHQTDQILSRLSISGIPTPMKGQGTVDIGISDQEKMAVDAWRNTLTDDGGRLWIGVGPGSRMPAKQWPLERYRTVIARLIEAYDIWPVIFGGPEDREAGNKLVNAWKRGYVAAGKLNVRQGVSALSRCAFYLGNDTGTMHMAVAAGISCVAIFSARDYPGIWYPYGNHHTIFRKTVDCEGCMLETCTVQGMKCMLSIGTKEVYRAAIGMLIV